MENNKKSTAKILITIKPEEKERLARIAEEHGLSLAALFRLSVKEYIEGQNWE